MASICKNLQYSIVSLSANTLSNTMPIHKNNAFN